MDPNLINAFSNTLGKVGQGVGRATNFATTPLQAPVGSVVGQIQQRAQNTPIMPFLPQVTPRTLAGINVPGATMKVPQAIQSAFPITQTPAVAQSFIRQLGRYAGLTPSPVDIAALPLYAKMLGKAPDFLSSPQGEEATAAVGRPAHQVAIEKALNNGDLTTAQQIIDNLHDADPYKQSMQSLIDRLMPQDQETLPMMTGNTYDEMGNINLLTPEVTGAPNYMPSIQISQEPTSIPEVLRALAGTMGFAAAPFVGGAIGRRIGAFANRIGR